MAKRMSKKESELLGLLIIVVIIVNSIVNFFKEIGLVIPSIIIGTTIAFITMYKKYNKKQLLAYSHKPTEINQRIIKTKKKEILNTNFIALDFETANDSDDSACSIGVVKVVNNQIVDAKSMLINPQSNISNKFKNIHGISNSDVRDAPLFPDAWKEFIPLLANTDFIAAHYATFDRFVLYACCKKYGMPAPKQPFICTLKIARNCWNLNPAKLNNVCDHLNIQLNHHDALSDAQACAQIVIKAVESGYHIHRRK